MKKKANRKIVYINIYVAGKIVLRRQKRYRAPGVKLHASIFFIVRQAWNYMRTNVLPAFTAVWFSGQQRYKKNEKWKKANGNSLDKKPTFSAVGCNQIILKAVINTF